MFAAWSIVLLKEVLDWYDALGDEDTETAELVGAAFDLLAQEGPSLGRPLVDSIIGSRIGNLKEMRPASSSRSEIRILFVFDPQRQAIVLAAGDKAGRWSRWYRENIPIAELRYDKWLAGGYDEEM
ncbi:MAG: type II toxin-antitoxin system RelE/ParE family toxin [Chloroflexia bacterium]|nr:type II toxin-antitoxin system RelE/ParE family toxin [Chloroflexia bacterium]